jgi:hypothetical protein
MKGGRKINKTNNHKGEQTLQKSIGNQPAAVRRQNGNKNDFLNNLPELNVVHSGDRRIL